MASLLFILLPSYSQATFSDYFSNTEQQANTAYEKGDYSTASHAFQDPYRKGVAYYRIGDYRAAEEMFRLSNRPGVTPSAIYNLGNTLVQQHRLHEAITAYEDVLNIKPDHQHAKENLELVKKMLEQQQENSDQTDNEQEQQQDSPQKENREEPTPDDKETDNAEEQENRDSEEPSQSPPDEENSPQEEQQPPPPDKEEEKPISRSQEDLDADLWLNQIKHDPKSFLKNKCYLESKRNGTKESVDPW